MPFSRQAAVEVDNFIKELRHCTVPGILMGEATWGTHLTLGDMVAGSRLMAKPRLKDLPT